MSFECLVREIDELREDIKFLEDLKRDAQNADPCNLLAIRALDGAIFRSNEKLEELMELHNATTPCTDENDVEE